MGIVLGLALILTVPSLTIAERTIAQAPVIDSRKTEADRFLDQGVEQFNISQFEAAFQSWQQALKLYREIKDRLGEGGAIGNLGSAYHNLGNYQKAIEYHEKRLAISREIKDRKGEGQSTGNLGSAYYALGNYPKAIEYHEQHLAIAREIKDRKGEKQAIGNLGIVYNLLGNYPKAIEYGEQSLAIAREIKDRKGEGQAIGHLGSAYDALGDYPKAIEYQEQRLAIAREIKDRLGEGTALSNLGSAYDALGDYPKAIEYHEQHLAIAREIKDRLGEGQSIGNLGSTYYDLGNYPKAIEYQEQSLVIAREIKNRLGEYSTLNNLGVILEKQKEPELAIIFYKQSVQVIESIRSDNRPLSPDLQSSYTDIVAGTYRSLADLLINQGRIGEAQQVLERLKIQELNDFTKGTRSPQSITQIELNKYETDIKNKHTSLIAFGTQFYECEQNQSSCPQFNDLKTQYKNLSKEFQAYIETLKQQLKDTRLATVDNATNDLTQGAKRIIEKHPNSILLYPLVLPDKTHILWSSKGGIFSKKATCPLSETALSKKVTEFSDLLKNKGDETRLKTLGKDLYDCLIKPIESEITANNIKHLILVPDRITNYIPIGALHDGQQYLIQRFATTNILAASKTNTQENLSQNSANIPTIGLGLSEKRADFPALPYVTQELQNIIKSNSSNTKGILPGQIYMNQQFDSNALEDNLRGNKILHIATHARFNPTNPKSSFLLLGDGSRYDIPNIQTLRNLSDIHLVVLSACETAQGGADAQGLEVAGLSSYFTGDDDKAKAVLASLWKVSDQSTSLWMQQFYKYLANGKSKADSLQAVQKDFIAGKLNSKDPNNDYSHPYHWAPFILIGNGL